VVGQLRQSIEPRSTGLAHLLLDKAKGMITLTEIRLYRDSSYNEQTAATSISNESPTRVNERSNPVVARNIANSPIC
jgi:hypothetical protein